MLAALSCVPSWAVRFRFWPGAPRPGDLAAVAALAFTTARAPRKQPDITRNTARARESMLARAADTGTTGALLLLGRGVEDAWLWRVAIWHFEPIFGPIGRNDLEHSDI